MVVKVKVDDYISEELMDIRIKEPMYVLNQGHEYVVRAGTVGVEKNRVVFFYDNTRTTAVGFPRDYCIENPHAFQVMRTLSDKEISLRDVLRIIEEGGVPSTLRDALCQQIKAL